jgi:hypothetical protein
MFPSQTSYDIQVTFTNSAPHFTQAANDIVAMAGIAGSYPLPTYVDDEGNPITISLTPVLPYIQIVGTKIEVLAAAVVGVNVMTLTISDEQP